MRILILEHERDAPAALLAEWASKRAHDMTTISVPSTPTWPDVRSYDAIVSLGSETSVHADARPWVRPELDLLGAAHVYGVPTLGICFGAQALARALGGEVRRAPRTGVRWRVIDDDPEGLITSGPWFFWHEDEFSLPPGAKLHVGTMTAVTAFTSRRSVALQFHPEADETVIASWIAGSRATLDDHGIDLEALRAQIERHARGARERAFTQFDRIAAWWRECSA
jgi:GMP synthase-like glutamine amidotransferase